jgi:hypothetical protein
MPKNPLEWQSLAFKNRNPRDLCIEFDEPTHIYTINGKNKGWISCTGFLHDFFPHFDADVTIKKMMNSSKWLTSPYYGMSADEIKEKWSNSAKEASGAGTALHLAIEMHHNGAEHLIPEDIKETPEWKYFLNYWKDFGGELEPYRTEWEVFSEKHKLAGSIDMIYKKKDGTYAVYDWKRSKEIKTSNDFENGYAPLDHLPNCNYWIYTLQLNVYKWFLETYYGLKITELCILIFHPDNKNYQRFRLNIMEAEVEDMLECRMRALETGSKSRVVLPEPSTEALFVVEE